MSNQSTATGLSDVALSAGGEAWSEIRTREHIVRYRRSGSGPALLLLDSPAESGAIWPEVVDVLSAGRRLIVPEPPSPDTEVEPWLSVLFDGLGMSNVTVVASDGFCIAALERALLEPDRIARVILVCRGRGSEGGVRGAIDSVPHLATVPLLVLRRERPASEILPLVERFLEREVEPAIA